MNTPNTPSIPVAPRVNRTTIPEERLNEVYQPEMFPYNEEFNEKFGMHLRSNGIKELVINRRTRTFTIYWI